MRGVLIAGRRPARRGGPAADWSPLDLFVDGQDGVIFEPRVGTAFTDTGGALPAAVNDEIAFVTDESGNGHHAVQADALRRPVLRAAPDRMECDMSADRLTITVPTGGWAGTMIVSTVGGALPYGVTIPAGTHEIGPIGGSYAPDGEWLGVIIRNGEMSPAEIDAALAYFRGKSGVVAYEGVTSVENWFRDWAFATDLPLFDTSLVSNFARFFYGAGHVGALPAYDFSSALNMDSMAMNASISGANGISAPLCTDFGNLMRNCSNLSGPFGPFAAGATGADYSRAFWGAAISSLSGVDIDRGGDYSFCFANCGNLADIPPGMFDNSTTGQFRDAFASTNLTQTSIDNVLASLVACGVSAGEFDQSGGSAPSAAGQASIDTLRARSWTVTVTGGY